MGVMMGRIISSRRKQWVQVLNNKMPGTIKDSVQYQFFKCLGQKEREA